MELINATQKTVTIKMNVQKEFLPIFAVFMAVHQEYDQLDREIHNVSREEVAKIERSLAAVLHALPPLNK